MNKLDRNASLDIVSPAAYGHLSVFSEDEMALASFGFWRDKAKHQNYGRCGMDKIEEIARKRKAAHKKLLDLKSKTYKAFLAMEEAAYADGVLPKKIKELIAVGISLVINCESCMEWHIKEAARLMRRYWKHWKSGWKWAAGLRRLTSGLPWTSWTMPFACDLFSGPSGSHGQWQKGSVLFWWLARKDLKKK
jgi:AhpD family alkylhydroperoxidase